MAGGFVADHLMLDARVFTELAWWVNPTNRVGRVGPSLLKALTRWAKDHGATHIEMYAPNDRVASYYRRLGYMPLESAFIRRV